MNIDPLLSLFIFLLTTMAPYLSHSSRTQLHPKRRTMEQPTMDSFRGQLLLPKFAVPRRYDLKLKLDLIAFKFSGSAAIDVDIVSDTRFLVLNAAQLNFTPDSVSFTNPISSKVFKPSGMEAGEADEILVMEFAETLPIGMGVLAIQFEGILNDNLQGLYRSCYEHNGETKYMAVTQFQATDARRCFPCWDEPALKATFKMTLEVPSELVALSNMPIADEKVDGLVKTVSYQESPVMSTYLVAIVVGLFDYVEDHTPDGVKVRVYCEVGKANEGKFALDVAVKTLVLYKEYFGEPYSLPKLDMVAVPDFSPGGMENYGLVTYRVEALLYDDQNSAAANKQNIAIIVAHELAHQWFGNLVTMEWWTHLWLNEGFATWVSFLATDRLFPEWKSWTQFLELSTVALNADGLAQSHPIEIQINRTSEIGEIFDSISYSKGASIIRMLQSYLGADSFQKSLGSYIKKYAHSTAKTEDLWGALEEGTQEPVNKVMNTWTKQQGFPVVSVQVKEHRLMLEQSQFLTSGANGGGQWIVPISLCSGSYDARTNFLLEAKSDIKELNNSLANTNSSGSWIKVNVDQVGFYRVKYDEELSSRLRNAIQNKSLSALDRYGILDDSFALCVGRQQSSTSLLTLMDAYRAEDDFTVMSNVIFICYKVERIVADALPDSLDLIKQFFINLLQSCAEKLGWDPKAGESHLDAMLRGEILSALVVFGHNVTLNEASRRFQAFLDDRHTPLLNPDIRKAVYGAVMQSATTTNRSAYDLLLRLYRESDLTQEKNRILRSLGSSPDPKLVIEHLNFLLSPEIPSQEVDVGFTVSKEGREAAWAWLKDNWDHILKTWGPGNTFYFFRKNAATFASLEMVKDIEAFFATLSTPEFAKSLTKTIEKVTINANWVEAIRSEKLLPEALLQLANRK